MHKLRVLLNLSDGPETLQVTSVARFLVLQSAFPAV